MKNQIHFPFRSALSKNWRQARAALRAELERRRNRAIAKKAKGKILLFIFDSNCHGLFAHLHQCLELANWAATFERKVAFASMGSGYRGENESENWLPEILVQPSFDAPRHRRELMGPSSIWLGSTSFLAFPYWRYRVPPLTLESGRALFCSTFQYAPRVIAAMEETMASWARFFIVGVHLRGTDKKTEAAPVDHSVAIARIRDVLAELLAQGVKNARVFVATDENKFLQKVRAALGDLVIARKDVVRSDDERPTHVGSQRNSTQHAVDAMVDAVLLSKCRILLKTASFLSGFSAMLASRQLVFMLNRPYENMTWFPDADVLKRSARFDDLRPALKTFLAPEHATAIELPITDGIHAGHLGGPHISAEADERSSIFDEHRADRQ